MVLFISKRLSFSITIKRYVSSKPWSYEQASAWIESFNKQKIPKEHTTVSFSRSSGPGGQNVDLRLSLSKATWIPEYARDALRSLPN
ncbi:hypothetical protein CU097_001790, partial [Rhizopus azygosporus]